MGSHLFFPLSPSDAMQAKLGTCRVEDIAVAVVATVIGVYPLRNEILIDAGWTALSMQGADQGYGLVAPGQPQLR